MAVAELDQLRTKVDQVREPTMKGWFSEIHQYKGERRRRAILDANFRMTLHASEGKLQKDSEGGMWTYTGAGDYGDGKIGFSSDPKAAVIGALGLRVGKLVWEAMYKGNHEREGEERVIYEVSEGGDLT